MSSLHAKKILIVPLDWGLGHTTRCVPLIRVLLSLGHEVFVGGTAVTNAILQAEFPNLLFFEFPSYNITYPKKGNNFMLHLTAQLPHLARVVFAEKKVAKRLAVELNLDMIISDNRFGVRSKKCKNVFISHQLNLSIPGNRFLEFLANRCNHFFINKFNQVFVPDWKNHLLSGTLSHSDNIKIPVEFMGSISRWGSEKKIERKKQVLVILSGPEPQRTILEDIIISQADLVCGALHIVRALPKENKMPSHDTIFFYNHLSGSDLEKLALESDYIISRAGYTTIMDLVAIQKHAMLIPTPGQTEQEYLAAHLDSQQLFHFYNQNDFNLSKALTAFDTMEWGTFPNENNQLKKVWEQYLMSS